MKTCPNCNKEMKDTAKFCGGCGYKFPEAAPVAAVSAEGRSLESVGNTGYIRWALLPGQLAVKVDEAEIEACGKLKGISIQEGTRALFFVNGEFTSELESGNYELSDFDTAGSESTSTTGGFFNFLKEKCKRAWRAIVGSPVKVAISVVLVRSTEFPLLFVLKDANTAGIRCDLGMHLIGKINNINEFFRNQLLDRKFVSYEQMQQELQPVVAAEVNLAVSAVTPEQVGNNPALADAVLVRLQTALASSHPYVSAVRIVQLSAQNQALEAVRRMSEELYVSEQELVQLQKRNDFLNRLQAVKNAQLLKEGHSEADFAAGKLEIYKRMALTEDEQAKFDLMLAAERKLREAKSEDEIAAAMHEYEKTGMLRGHELERIRHQGRMADLRDTQEYELSTLQGELTRQRVQDEYTEARREREAAFEDSRRRAELQLDREEQQNQLELLRQAQAIRMEREEAEHRRQLATEQQKIDAQLEHQRIYAGMTVEQIMAANPNISPEAAKALAQKFSAESKEELLRAREADMARQNAQQMEMMRMMQQMAVAGMGVRQAHQDELIQAKDAELRRVREDANLNQDRVLAGMQTSLTAAGTAFSGVRAPVQPPKGQFCPKCGATLEGGARFCGECGASM